MAKKRHSKSKLQGVHKAFKRRSPGFRTPLQRLATLKSARRVREWIDMSLAEMGEHVARLTGRPQPYVKSAVSAWENGSYMDVDIRRAYGILIANKLTALLDREVGVTIEANSPWHVIAWFQCACRKWTPLKRSNQQRCPSCTARRTSK